MVESSTLHNSLIMMVDDDPVMLSLIQLFLEDAGYYHFCGLSDSTKAVAEVQNKRPDILLLDLIMPEVNGFEVLAQLRGDPKTKHLPVVVLTSSSDNDTKLKALDLGATDFLAKPVDRSELVLRLRNTLTFKLYQDQLAFYDALTGLPNKALYQERLNSALGSFNGQGGYLSLVNLRLAQFRKLAESFGPKTCDALLKAVAQRLLECVRSSDVISHGGHFEPRNITAHLGGDEFSILLTRTKNEDDAAFVSERLIDTFQRPFVVDGEEIYLTPNIGISVYPSDGNTAEVLISRASRAADQALEAGGANYQYYSQQANQKLKQRLNLQQALRRAIQESQFHLVYQPQVDAKTRCIKGAEALLRWKHPDQGYIPPAHFIPIAEESGLMIELGEYVLREACQQAVSWSKQGMEPFTISVNVSGQQFKADNFVQSLQAIIQETGANPANLVIEITENLSMSDVPRSSNLIRDIRALGIEVAVDDFGTGYCSLSYLRELPVDELKIDKAFVDGLPDDTGDQAITSAVVMMARKLGLRIVAEGVENSRQLDYLCQLGCDVIQGFYFSKPLAAEDYLAYYHSSTPLTAA